MYHFQGHQAYNNNNKSSSSGPPPAKRQKSNAVVTYYPPPPGYVPPPNAQIPQAAWQAAGYNANSYGSQQQYPQQQYPQQQYPQQQYPQHQYGQQQYSQQYGQQQYPQQYYQGPGQPGYPPYQGHNGYQQPNGWQQHQQQQQGYGYAQNQGNQADSYQYSPPQYSQPGFVPPYSGSPQNMTSGTDQQQKPISQSRQASMSYSAPAMSVSGDDEEFPANEYDETDFTREASFAKEADSVNPELSLGIIVYYPARPVKTALPSTYDEAQEQMIDLTPRIGEDEAVSRYFNSSQSANFNLSVRESEEWDQLKDDMIFRSFPPRAEAEFTKIQQVKADRERPDPHPESRYPPFITDVPSHRRSGSPSPVAEPVSETGSDAGNEDDQAMDTDSDDDEMVVSPKAFTAVEVTEPNAAEPADNEHKATQALHQIAAENDAMLTDKLKQSQDPVQDRLEELGVTGSPKAHVADEAAARQSDVAQINPPPHESRRESSARRHGNGFQPYNNRRTSAGYQGNDHRRPDHRQNISGFHANGHHHGKRKFSDSGMPYGPHNVPPPPERHQDSWSAEPYGEARQRSGSVGSSTSQRTVPGGDFDANEDDHERTPRAQPHSQQPGSGRKRDYDEMERSNNNDRRRQADDVTPRMRRGRPKVPDAYSRRYR